MVLLQTLLLGAEKGWSFSCVSRQRCLFLDVGACPIVDAPGVRLFLSFVGSL